MLFKGFPVGPMGANCYLLGCPETQEGVIIDPGGEAEKIKSRVEEMGLKVVYIVLTHGHIDHIMAVDEVRRATGARVAIHADDASMLVDPSLNLSAFMGRRLSFTPADVLLRDGDVLPFGKQKLEVIHTPGHTPGGICLYTPGYLFTGDTLFAGSIGRTDFPGGDFDTLINSIRNRLFTLPEDTSVYPGHMNYTTIGYERDHNPFLR